MTGKIPLYISIVFIITTLLTLFLFYRIISYSTEANTKKNSNKILLILIIWLIIQAVLSVLGIYNTNTHLIPPKILLFGVLPIIITMVLLFSTKFGKQFIDGLPLKEIIYLNSVRIPVELVLYWLFLCKAVPQIMTFEGNNFDILAGITAPIIAYYGFTKNRISKKIILVWNFISLALLLNIIVIALLSAPSPFQKISFEQPNIAILNFPFSWLPSFIVPIVLLGHLIAIRKLWKQK